MLAWNITRPTQHAADCQHTDPRFNHDAVKAQQRSERFRMSKAPTTQTDTARRPHTFSHSKR
jgi:hypothetical protein